MWFQKISILTPWKVTGNSRGRGSQQPKFIRESMKLNWNFQGSVQVQMKKPSMGGGMDIFWSHILRLTHSLSPFGTVKISVFFFFSFMFFFPFVDVNFSHFVT